MSKKKLLVLAASAYQVDTILTAKRLGYVVLTTDNVPGNPGHELADRAYDVDTTDREGVLRIAQSEGIAGIIAPCTDVAVETAAYVSSTLGLQGVPPASAELLTRKLAFREFLRVRTSLIRNSARGSIGCCCEFVFRRKAMGDQAESVLWIKRRSNREHDAGAADVSGRSGASESGRSSDPRTVHSGFAAHL